MTSMRYRDLLRIKHLCWRRGATRLYLRPMETLVFLAMQISLMANNDYLADNRETVVKYMRGLVKGTLENEKDTDFGANLAVDEYGADLSLDIDQQKDENRLQQAFQNSPLTAEKGVLSVSADVIVDEMYPGVIAAGITDPPAPDTYLDTSILEEVHASL